MASAIAQRSSTSVASGRIAQSAGEYFRLYAYASDRTYGLRKGTPCFGAFRKEMLGCLNIVCGFAQVHYIAVS